MSCKQRKGQCQNQDAPRRKSGNENRNKMRITTLSFIILHIILVISSPRSMRKEKMKRESVQEFQSYILKEFTEFDSLASETDKQNQIHSKPKPVIKHDRAFFFRVET